MQTEKAEKTFQAKRTACAKAEKAKSLKGLGGSGNIEQFKYARG